MKDILQNLRGAVAKRLEQRNNNLPVPAQGALLGTTSDVRAAVINFGSYKWVLVLTLIAAVYYGLLASDRYVTEAQIYVKSTRSGTPSLPQLSLLVGGGDQAKDALVLRSYINSSDMLDYLDKEIGVKDHFSNSQWDFVARLESDPTEEDFLSYYRSMVDVSIDPESAVLRVKAEAFTPEYSQQLVQAILEEADRFINGISQKIAAEEISFVENEMARARDKVNSARDRLLRFQNDNQLLSPSSSGETLQSVVNQLETDLVALQTEEKALAAYLNDTAPQLVSVRNRIDSVKAQLLEERQKISAQDTSSINEVNAEFRELELELKFATDLYRATLEGLEQARVESYHKMKHLVVLQSPALPDEALEPRKLYNLASLFVLLSLAYGIVVMILATIREHRDV